MDPIRNPYAPGAGQRPPELAGRDEQLHAFDATLERVARDQPLRRPLSAALHMAVRELGHPQPDEVAQVLGVIKAFAQRESGPGSGSAAGGRVAGRGSAAGGAGRLRDRWSVGIDVPAVLAPYMGGVTTIAKV